jgi:hypothetical protein
MADDEDDFEQKPTPPPRTGNTPRSWRMSDSERDRHRRTWVRGVPVVRPEPADEVTAPLELLLNGQLDVDDYAQIEALRRSADDPYVLVMNLAKAISRHRDKERSGSREIEAKVIKTIGDQAARLASLEADNAETKRKLGFAQKVAAGAIAIAIASAGGLISKIWDRAGDEREATVERRYMKDDIDRLSKQLERMSRKDTP